MADFIIVVVQARLLSKFKKNSDLAFFGTSTESERKMSGQANQPSPFATVVLSNPGVFGWRQNPSVPADGLSFEGHPPDKIRQGSNQTRSWSYDSLNKWFCWMVRICNNTDRNLKTYTWCVPIGNWFYSRELSGDYTRIIPPHQYTDELLMMIYSETDQPRAGPISSFPTTIRSMPI